MEGPRDPKVIKPGMVLESLTSILSMILRKMLDLIGLILKKKILVMTFMEIDY